MLAERLVADRGYEVEVLTTCALDAITWRDELPEGTSSGQRRTVHRIRSEAGRDEHFHPLWAAMREDPARPAAPTWSAGSTCRGRGRRRCSRRWRPATPTSWPSTRTCTTRPCGGCRWWPSAPSCIRRRTRSPRCTCPSSTSSSPAAGASPSTAGASAHWSTARFGVATTPQVLVGLGVEEPRRGGGSGTRRGAGRLRAGGVPYLVCIGRVDDQKGTGMLWRFFRAYKRAPPGPAPPRVRRPGGRPARAGRRHRRDGHDRRRAKWGLLRGARVLVAPSPHESFSLTVVEALTAGVPGAGERGVRCRRGSTASSRGRGCGSGTSPNSRPRSACLTTDDAVQRDDAPATAARYVEANYTWPVDPGPLLRVPGALRRRGSAASAGEGRAVAVEVGLLREGAAPRRAERRGEVAERDHGDRHHLGRQAQRGRTSSSPPRTGSVVSVEPSPSAWAASSRFCTAGKTEASMDCGIGQPGVAADHDQHRCGGDAAHGPAVDVTQEGGGEALLLERPGAALPQARRQLADGGAQAGIADDDEHEGLAVLRARRVRGRREDARDGLVVDVVGKERPGRPLGVHHLEEVGSGRATAADGTEQGSGPPRTPAAGLGAAEAAPLPLALHRPGAGARHDDVVGDDGGGGQEADGGRRCRIARRGAQGDHRPADRQVQGGRGAGTGAALRRRRAEHEPDLPQPRRGQGGRLRRHPGPADLALRHGVLGQVRRRCSRPTRRRATRS